jgi:hypothetical protein
MQVAMEVGDEGPHRQQAVLEGLKLLNMALEYDQPAAEQLNMFTVRERLAPLHHLLVTPHRRLAVLLQYVLFEDSAVQSEVRDALYHASPSGHPLYQLLRYEHGSRMGVSWVTNLSCHGCVMGVSWVTILPCHGCVMGVSWVCHG